ncbi:MAG: hypothetical protein ACI8UO_005236 [Verrucomicrobiales bacterium]|jgi:hypothetical protein
MATTNPAVTIKYPMALTNHGTRLKNFVAKKALAKNVKSQPYHGRDKSNRQSQKVRIPAVTAPSPCSGV